MSDTSSLRSSVRASVFLNRPQITPTGPRTRHSTLRVFTVNENAGPTSPTVAGALPGAMSPSSSPTPQPLSRSNSTSPKPLPVAPSPVKPLPSLSSRNSTLLPSPSGPQLPSLAFVSSPLVEAEEFQVSERQNSGQESPSATHSSANSSSPPPARLSALTEATNMTLYEGEEEEEAAPAYSNSLRQESISQPLTLVAKPGAPFKATPIIHAHPKLVPPPPIKFETSAVPWKSLPLEAALCESPLST